MQGHFSERVRNKKHLQLHHKTKRGFTLVELSIVLVIIGLIVAGVTAGQALVKQARLRAIVTDTQKYLSALAAFKLQYDALPGDMSDASSYWSVDNGDGDRTVEYTANAYTSEDRDAWEHLSNADLVSGSYSDAVAPAAGSSQPGAYTNGLFGLLYISVFGTSYNAISVAGFYNSTSSNGYYRGSLLTATQGKSVDDKIDDGVANTGALLGVDGDDASGVCSDAIGDTGADYDVSDTTSSCRLFYTFHL